MQFQTLLTWSLMALVLITLFQGTEGISRESDMLENAKVQEEFMNEFDCDFD